MEMTELAASGDDLLAASTAEMDRPGPSYTADTLEALAEQHPGDELWFLMGADVAEGLERWSRPERVVELAHLGIAARAGSALDEVEATLERLGTGARHEVVSMPELGVSSTLVRRRVAQGRPVRYLVPDPVIELIDERGLYR
jgi:nicotinate-nucleotide adenylyltransferase